MYSQCGEDWKQARVEKVFKENIKRFQKNKILKNLVFRVNYRDKLELNV